MCAGTGTVESGCPSALNDGQTAADRMSNHEPVAQTPVWSIQVGKKRLEDAPECALDVKLASLEK